MGPTFARAARARRRGRVRCRTRTYKSVTTGGSTSRPSKNTTFGPVSLGAAPRVLCEFRSLTQLGTPPSLGWPLAAQGAAARRAEGVRRASLGRGMASARRLERTYAPKRARASRTLLRVPLQRIDAREVERVAESAHAPPKAKHVEVGRRSRVLRRARSRCASRMLRRVYRRAAAGARRRTSSRRTCFDR